MTDETPTIERSPREPFAGVPVRDLVRDVVAVFALLVGLGLPWTATARGSDRLEVVLTTVLAVAVLALPYARRAQVLTGSWAADERRTRWLGLAPVTIVAVIHLLLDVLPGDALGVGAGLGLSLSGVILAAGLSWRHDVLMVAGIIALGAVATPVVAATSESLEPSTLITLVLTGLLTLAVLWLTAGRFVRGAEASGVLLVAVGVVLAVGATLVGGAFGGAWVESVHGTRFGYVLLPVLAAVAVPRVVGRQVAVDDQPRLWATVAVQALELGIVLGGYTAAVAVVALTASTEDLVGSVLRLIFGLVVAVMLFFARRALSRDLAAGHATAVGASAVAAGLGCVLLAVRADGSTVAGTIDWLLAFVAPATVLAVLLVPRSLREVRSAGTMLAVVAPAADPTSADPTSVDATSDVDATSAADPAAADPAADTPSAVGAQQPARAVEPDPAVASGVRAYPPSTSPGGAGITMSAAAGETTILAPVTTTPTPHGVGWAAPASAETQAVGAQAGAAAAGQPVTPAQSAEQTAVGPFGAVGSTQVMPAINEAPTPSGWSITQALDPATPLADLAQIVQEAPELRRYVAANPSTYPALLDWLGALGDPEIDAALRARG